MTNMTTTLTNVPAVITLDYATMDLQSNDSAHDLWVAVRRRFPLRKASDSYLRAMRAQIACLVSQVDAEMTWREAKARGEITTG